MIRIIGGLGNRGTLCRRVSQVTRSVFAGSAGVCGVRAADAFAHRSSQHSKKSGQFDWRRGSLAAVLGKTARRQSCRPARKAPVNVRDAQPGTPHWHTPQATHQPPLTLSCGSAVQMRIQFFEPRSTNSSSRRPGVPADGGTTIMPLGCFASVSIGSPLRP